MIPSTILQSVYNFEFNKNSGSGFFVKEKNKQYFITAHHVVKGIEKGNTIKIRHEKKRYVPLCKRVFVRV